jgi:gliding motility-associated-like protein
MKKKLPLKSVITLLLINTISYAQFQNGLWVGKDAYNWYFGVNAGLNFQTSPPTSISNGQIEPVNVFGTGELDNNSFLSDTSSSSISDSEGNLLFYTNGNTVWNRNHEVMENGTYLICGTDLLQSTIIVKALGDNQKYYIIGVKPPANYTIEYPESYGLQDPVTTPMVVYSEVDMNLNNGLGAVTLKNNILAGFDEPAYGRITATHHADQNQIWTVTHDVRNNTFKAFLISDNGVSTTPVISEIGFKDPDYPDALAQMKFSPDGTKIVKTLQTVINQKVEIFGFDNATGQVTELIAAFDDFDFLDEGEIYGVQGVEFSPNSRYLYLTGTLSGFLKQIDTEAGTEAQIRASATNLYIPSDNSQVYNFYMQVAPDGKIYLAYGDFPFGGLSTFITHTTMNVINYPNNPGVSAGYEQDGIDLVTGKSGWTVPVFTQSYFESGILYDGTCVNTPISFSTIRIPGIDSIAWDFGDPASGVANTSSDLLPLHTYSIPGMYTITAVITSNGAQQTATTHITVIEGALATAPLQDLLKQCSDSGYSVFNLDQFSDAILNGQDPVNYTLNYFANQNDLDNNNPIDNTSEFTSAGQQLFAKVSNNVTGCSATTQFNLIVNPLPQANIPPPIEKCSNLGTSEFNLKQQDAAILSDQDAQNYTVTYFIDPNAQNPITSPEHFISSGQAVYAVVVNNSTDCTSHIISFNINVNELLIENTLRLTGCSPFNLNALKAQVQEGLQLTFYKSQQDAENAENAIADIEQYNILDEGAVIYVQVTNQDGCSDVAEVMLLQDGCTIPKGISPNGDDKNDNFDLSGFDVIFLGIYNRFGQEVYSHSNYTSEWHGQSSSNGELPTGTYYYMLQRGNGNSLTGWVYVNREE